MVVEGKDRRAGVSFHACASGTATKGRERQNVWGSARPACHGPWTLRLAGVPRVGVEACFGGFPEGHVSVGPGLGARRPVRLSFGWRRAPGAGMPGE